VRLQYIIGVFIAMFIFSCEKKDPASLIRKIKPSVVTIVTFSLSRPTSFPGYFKYDTLSQGSGFFVSSRGDIVTNYHVCNSADSAIVRTFDEKIFIVKGVIAEDEESDIIMLTTDAPKDSYPFLQITSNLPVEGENIIAIGSPLGLEHTTSNGIVSSVRVTKDGKKLIQITAPISPGSSGGPVINMKGQVIGIASYQLVRGQNLNFAVSGEQINLLQFQEEQNLSFWNANKKIVGIFQTDKLIERGDAYRWMGHYEAALLFYRKALIQAPSNAKLFNAIANCFAGLERYGDAIDYYNEAIRLDPKDDIYYLNLTKLFYKIDRLDDAIEYAKKAINADPMDNSYYSILAHLYRETGHLVEAIKERKKAINTYIKYNNDEFVKRRRIGMPCAKLHKIGKFYCYSESELHEHWNDMLFEYYREMGEDYCFAGDTNAALEIYDFLKLRDPSAKKLYDIIYPPLKLNN